MENLDTNTIEIEVTVSDRIANWSDNLLNIQDIDCGSYFNTITVEIDLDDSEEKINETIRNEVVDRVSGWIDRKTFFTSCNFTYHFEYEKDGEYFEEYSSVNKSELETKNFEVIKFREYIENVNFRTEIVKISISNNDDYLFYDTKEQEFLSEYELDVDTKKLSSIRINYEERYWITDYNNKEIINVLFDEHIDTDKQIDHLELEYYQLDDEDGCIILTTSSYK